MAIAINQGNYSKKFGIDPPGTIFIPKKSRAPRQTEAQAAATPARKR
jgi:hypothetical protein